MDAYCQWNIGPACDLKKSKNFSRPFVTPPYSLVCTAANQCQAVPATACQVWGEWEAPILHILASPSQPFWGQRSAHPCREEWSGQCIEEGNGSEHSTVDPRLGPVLQISIMYSEISVQQPRSGPCREIDGSVKAILFGCYRFSSSTYSVLFNAHQIAIMPASDLWGFGLAMIVVACSVSIGIAGVQWSAQQVSWPGSGISCGACAESW